jgi:hypothetical protein
MNSRAQHHHHFALGEEIKNEAQGRGRVSRNMHIMLQRHTHQCGVVHSHLFSSGTLENSSWLDSSGRDAAMLPGVKSAFTFSAVGANASSRGGGIDKPAKVGKSRGMTGLRPTENSDRHRRTGPMTGMVGGQTNSEGI